MFVSSALRRGTAVATSVLVLAGVAACSSDESEPVSSDASSSCDVSEFGELSGPPDEVVYLTGFGDTAREGYVAVASELGTFADLNLAVSVEGGSGLGANLAALVGGAADFAVVDAAGLFENYLSGDVEGVQALAAVHQQYPMALFAFSDSGIERPRDLNGRTIGLVPGAVGDQYWPTYAALTPGLDPETVEIVPVNNADQTTDLVAGRVDAIALFTMAAPATRAAGAAAGRGELTVLEWSQAFPDLYGYVLAATKDLVVSDPGLAARFTAGLLCGLDYATTNPQEAGEILLDVNPQLNPEAAVEELELLAEISRGGLQGEQPLGYIDLVRVSRGMDMLTDAGLITTDFSQVLPQPGGPLDEGVINFEIVPGAQLGLDGAEQADGQGS